MVEEGGKKDSPFKLISRKHNISEAQLLLKWGIQKGYPVIPKSIKKERLEENIDLFGFDIGTDDMEIISQLDKGDGVAWSSGDPTLVP